MKKESLYFFGGTGGLGSRVSHLMTQLSMFESIKNIGSNACDITNELDIKNYFDHYRDVGNLVIFTNYNYNSFLHSYKGDDLSELDKQLNVNIKGVIQVISSALRIMRENEYGRIIIASSILADTPERGAGIYSATKAFYENLVKTICKENAWKNITANCIQLGYMDGGLTYKLPPGFLDAKLKTIPSGRLGTPREIADTIRYIVDTPFLNGSTIKLTGGL